MTVAAIHEIHLISPVLGCWYDQMTFIFCVSVIILIFCIFLHVVRPLLHHLDNGFAMHVLCIVHYTNKAAGFSAKNKHFRRNQKCRFSDRRPKIKIFSREVSNVSCWCLITEFDMNM